MTAPKHIPAFRIATIILCASLAWSATAWFIAKTDYFINANNIVSQEQTEVQRYASELANSVNIGVQDLRNIPDLLADATFTQHALFQHPQPPDVAREKRKAVWEAYPPLKEFNQFLASRKQHLHAGLLFVLNAQGDCISASNAQTEHSIVGQNFAERDYFKATQQGQRGVQYAVGKITHVSGLFFSTPLYLNGKFYGAMVLKIDTPQLAYLVQHQEAFISDQNGVIILAHDEKIERSAMPNATLAKLSASTQFGLYQREHIATLAMQPAESINDIKLFKMYDSDLLHVFASAEIPELNLTVHISSKLPQLEILKHERTSLFFLSSLIGILLICSVAGVTIYLRMLRRAKFKIENTFSILKATLESTADGILTIDTSGHIRSFNQRFVELWHIPQDLIAQGDDERTLTFAMNQLTDPDAFIHKVHDLYQHPEQTSFDILEFKDGRTFERYSLPQRMRDAVIGRVWSFRDVTERKKAEQMLQLSASVFTHAREGILITDADGTIIDINETFTHISGYSRAEVLGKNPRMFQSGRQSPQFYEMMWQSLAEKGHWYGEIWNRRKSGEFYAEMINIAAVRNVAGKSLHYVALITDITPLKNHEEQLNHIAHYDVLTGLPNRVLLADRLQQAIVQSQRRKLSLAVVFLDLDGFKSVNDQHGHASGDQLLITVAQRMKLALREGDTLARIGGDEFVAILVDLENTQACEPVLARMLLAASEPVPIDEIMLHVSASIGVTLYPHDGADAEQLMRHADQAMYIAKQSGKNRYHLFDVRQDEAVQTQRESLDRIRLALERQEFVLYYQPKVNMRTGVVIGAEALIRWQHPEHGLLAPGVFLPIVEDRPLGVEIGVWVIDTALTQLGTWNQSGLTTAVSVNISARQLQSEDFVPQLTALLAAHPDVSPAQLELEILETTALGNVTQVSEVIQKCHDLGVSFALDDFGTGYSSLTYLKHLPADVIKIDQSFVRGMLEDQDDIAIVEGILGLSSAFRRQIIAEGVETLAHGTMLLKLGCDFAQGYGIARPMPAHQLANWIKVWRPDATWSDLAGHTFSKIEIEVAVTEVLHRNWIKNLEKFLSNQEDSPPAMSEYDCRLGRWLSTQGRLKFGHHPVFQEVIIAHQNVHAMGRKLVGLHSQGIATGTETQLDELHQLREDLIAKLHKLA